MKRIALTALLAAALVLAAEAAWAFTVGFIDLNRAVVESEYGVKVKGEIDELIKKRRTEIEARIKERDKLKDEIEKQSGTGLVSEDAMRKKVAEFERLSRDIERFYNDTNEELEKLERDRYTSLLKEVSDVASDYGRQNKYDLLLRSEAVLYSVDGVDITDKVIEAFNKKKAAKK